MALFQRRPQSSNPKTFYTVGMNKNVLIAGLGNPGKEYELTRHNAGFICVDEFVTQTEEMGDWVKNDKLKCHLSRGQIAGLGVLAVKPMTFMNDSGQAIEAVSRFYKVHPDQVLVIHDELDIDFGKIRLRHGGSDAGHKGIRSVTEKISEDYSRIRIGVGPKSPPEIDSIDFVLQRFSAEEQKQLPSMTREVSAIISEYLYGSQQLPHETRSFII
jgi:PTH1 family peptidyl-tRNA hydrolase